MRTIRTKEPEMVKVVCFRLVTIARRTIRELTRAVGVRISLLARRSLKLNFDTFRSCHVQFAVAVVFLVSTAHHTDLHSYSTQADAENMSERVADVHHVHTVFVESPKNINSAPCGSSDRLIFNQPQHVFN